MNDVVQAPKAHLFQKGKSGNPAGRPKGSRNAISLVKLQIEGELRARMRKDMAAVVDEIVRQALPTTKLDPKTGEETILPGSQEMLKLLYKSWVSGTKASEDDVPKDKIVIQIGKLEQMPDVTGTTFEQV